MVEGHIQCSPTTTLRYHALSCTSTHVTRKELPCAMTWFCVSYIHGHVQLTYCIQLRVSTHGN